jgi:uncharacterized protein YndB with AHSA1/START domain
LTRRELTLQLTGVMGAPRESVWKALTDPDELSRWWGPDGFTSPRIEQDLRVGGRYRIAMQPPEGELFHLSGEFRELDPPARLAYTFVWEPPNPDDQETVAALSLADLGDSTELTLEQGPFATEERLALHREGWTQSFEKLKGLFPGT